MRNTFTIFLVSLILSGCFIDKSEKAIENCADDKINYISSSNKILIDEFKNDNRYAALEAENKIHQQKQLAALVKFEKFINDNFRNPADLIKYYKPYLYGIRNILEQPTMLTYKNEGGTKTELFMIRLELENLSQNALEYKIQERTSSIELSKYKRDRFKRWSIKKKFLNDRYAKYYKRCELDYNRTPKTFVATWSGK